MQNQRAKETEREAAPADVGPNEDRLPGGDRGPAGGEAPSEERQQEGGLAGGDREPAGGEPPVEEKPGYFWTLLHPI